MSSAVFNTARIRNKMMKSREIHAAAQQRHAPDAPSARLSCTLRRGAGDAGR
jgi:hypothetical protein